ncbi:hypothetical protein L6475_07275 [Prevotella sp. E9-3]|uniref:hypothetical protein n=1 Tax=Prevotella sp. E9-3 TaxID=2913621 RepID=UPI001EDBB8E3|nr:hypothetical protein [Prevotella sp. E9-3]UKK47046.1 hypothetical protein L6475_07275 [Prevotella sp. E9-3]
MYIEKDDASNNELWRRFHHRDNGIDNDDDRQSDRFYKLRQILNLVFLIMSVVGIVMWFYGSRDMGIYVLIIGTIFKFAELSLRIIKF